MTRSPRRRQAGFSIVTAIFLIVVLAGLGAAMMQLSSVQQSTTSLDIDGSRAYQAARAGIEWGVYQALRGPGLNGSCAAATTVALPAPSLSGMRLTVSCAEQVSGTIISRRISALACNAAACPAANPGPNYVERALEARVERLAVTP